MQNDELKNNDSFGDDNNQTDNELISYDDVLLMVVNSIVEIYSIDINIAMFAKKDIINIAMSSKVFYSELKAISDSITRHDDCKIDPQCFFMFGDHHPTMAGRRCHNNLTIRNGTEKHIGNSYTIYVAYEYKEDLTKHECIPNVCKDDIHLEYDGDMLTKISNLSQGFGEYLYEVKDIEKKDNVWRLPFVFRLCPDHSREISCITGISASVRRNKNANVRCNQIISSMDHDYIDQITHKHIQVKGIPKFMRCTNYVVKGKCHLHESRIGLCTHYIEKANRYCRYKISDNNSQKCKRHAPKDVLSVGLTKKCANKECPNKTRNIFCNKCINSAPKCKQEGCNKPRKMGKYCFSHHFNG